MTYSVFVSYSSKDRDKAEAVCQRLEGDGFSCWIAPRDIRPGSDWGESILNAIDSSEVMVLLLSHNANISSHVKREVERAVNKGLEIIPLRVQEVQPAKSLEYFISTSQWLDAYTSPFEKNLDRLIEVIRAIEQQGSKYHASPNRLTHATDVAKPLHPIGPKRLGVMFALAITFVSVAGGWALWRSSIFERTTSNNAVPMEISASVVSQLSIVDRAYMAATIDALINLTEIVYGVKISSSTEVIDNVVTESIKASVTRTLGDIHITTRTKLKDFELEKYVAIIHYLDPESLKPVTLQVVNFSLQSIDGPFSVSRFDQVLLSNGIKKIKLNITDEMVEVALAFKAETSENAKEYQTSGFAARE